MGTRQGDRRVVVEADAERQRRPAAPPFLRPGTFDGDDARPAPARSPRRPGPADRRPAKPAAAPAGAGRGGGCPRSKGSSSSSRPARCASPDTFDSRARAPRDPCAGRRRHRRAARPHLGAGATGRGRRRPLGRTPRGVVVTRGRAPDGGPPGARRRARGRDRGRRVARRRRQPGRRDQGRRGRARRAASRPSFPRRSGAAPLASNADVAALGEETRALELAGPGWLALTGEALGLFPAGPVPGSSPPEAPARFHAAIVRSRLATRAGRPDVEARRELRALAPLPFVAFRAAGTL